MGLRQAYRHGWNGRPGWRISFDYDEELVELLKRAIPHTDRAWYPDEKEWWIAEEYADVLERLFPDFVTFRNQPQLF